ncbi:retinoic acid early-inducible protein 1-alpha-like [Microtus oregoni]|uniref:retinoic acid early-inducible protein 1-alpha-like n=1 Tax=Microtus oregoni TaxID=111838 RepID=UPI001BB1EBB4|nr:retinoic acid early-inducible protein 1-alpha-like [Microtus oregoni]
MAKKAVAKHCLSTQALCSSILRIICLWSTLLADTQSLRCDIIVKAHPTPGQPWCEGQCSVDGDPLLQYNDSKFTPLGDLGNAANGTQVWTDMTQKLEYLWKELRKMLANTKHEITKISGQPTLKTTMLSQYEHGQSVGASWRFNISGKYSFLFNTMNMNWTLIDCEAGGIMNKWKDDEQFVKDLKIISTADCRHWLKELLKHQKKKPRPTSSTTDITQLPYTMTTTQILSSNQFSNKKIFTIIAVVSTISIILSVIVGIYKYVKRKYHPQGDRNFQLPMNCLVNRHKPQIQEKTMEPNGEFPNQATKMLSQEDEPKTWE